MKYLPVILLMAFFNIVHGQDDTTRIYHATELNKGIYNNYTDFITNSPSIIKDFTIKLFRKSKTDSTIIAAEYKFIDSLEKNGQGWGFCDGTNVYVNLTQSLFIKQAWKLECLGPLPFFSYMSKDIFWVPLVYYPLITVAKTALSAALPATNALMIIDEKGKMRDVTTNRMKKILANKPDLLKSFTEAIGKFGERTADTRTTKYQPPDSNTEQTKLAVMKAYLFKLNGVLEGN